MLVRADATVSEVLHPILGYDREDWAGRSGLELIHETDRPAVVQAFASALATPGAVVSREYRVRHKDGTWRWVEAVATNLLHVETVAAIVLNYRDITERKTLQQELEERSKALAQTNTALRQFLHFASHDLKEPVRTVNNFAELLQRRHSNELSSDAHSFLSLISRAALAMDELIDDLLIYAGITSGEITEPEWVDLNEVMHDVLQALTARIAESGATVDYRALPVIVCRRAHVHQLLQNLVSNSIKYKKPGVAPHVRVTAEQRGGAAILTVTDNGIGIDSAYHERIFGMFQRLHGKEVPGTGLGLSICKRIVEQYGGSISVESGVGLGSSFQVTLPLPQRS